MLNFSLFFPNRKYFFIFTCKVCKTYIFLENKPPPPQKKFFGTFWTLFTPVGDPFYKQLWSNFALQKFLVTFYCCFFDFFQTKSFAQFIRIYFFFWETTDEPTPNIWTNLWTNLWAYFWAHLWANLWKPTYDPTNLWTNVWLRFSGNPYFFPIPEFTK